MPDPISITAAIALGSKAVSQVNRLLSQGREVKDCYNAISRFFEASSDVNKAKERAENPSVVKKLLNSKSISEEAVQSVLAAKAMRENRLKLREMIVLYAGRDVWEELLQEEKRIRAVRKKAIHDRIVFRQKLIDIITIVIGASAIIGILVGFVYVLSLGGK
ncbi:putative DNA polymerase [uncultured Mediterranean phage uvMED]|nr:putative DNA polymerase [uncultured Mediterranean phage uvMED]BAQ88916.1 putative DNA polymerase [uncultured Mediterranean phage uvMED]BAQ88965.1 putative DNA polymerase [uncultured Mediterranean phage uvMED]BAQ89031.1 putative DNA polymerase [uncultured Mediterranean phage uvMED]BAQ89101.1 putative DNA polymerase [uncultured Mediterranean phage uvMED]